MIQQKVPQQLQEVEVEVLRPFTDHKRQVTTKGAVIKLPRIFALEMKAANKVKFTEPKPSAPVMPAPAGSVKKEK